MTNERGGWRAGRRGRWPGGAGQAAPAAAVALAVLLLLGLVPAAVAQPGPLRDGFGNAAPDHRTTQPPTASDATAPVPAAPSDGARAEPGGSSRPRPTPAPRPAWRAAASETPPARDGAAPAGDATSGSNRSVRPRGQPSPLAPNAAVRVAPAAGDRAANASGARVWPMRAGSFSFSQAFGCVAQIGGFYREAPGCPPAAPVIHTGIDLAAPQGTRFYAAAAGWVTEAGLDRPDGLANTQIVIQHDGANDDYATEYLHWITTYVRRGEYVRAGQPIGEVGSVGYSTGPHLHFGVVDLDSGERLDPSRWLPRDPATGAYLGLAPGSAERTFDNVGKDVPDWADPKPPPPPTRQRVPDRPPASPRPSADSDRDRPSAPPPSDDDRSGDDPDTGPDAGNDGANDRRSRNTDDDPGGDGASGSGGDRGGDDEGNGGGGAGNGEESGRDRTDGSNGDDRSPGGRDREDPSPDEASREEADRDGGNGGNGGNGEDRGDRDDDAAGADEPTAEEPTAEEPPPEPAAPWMPDLSAVPSLAPAQADGEAVQPDADQDDGNGGGRDDKERRRGG